MYSKKFLILSIFTIFLFSLGQTIFITSNTTGQATLGAVEICFNTDPTIIFNCETTLNQSTTENPVLYTCQLNASDFNTDQLLTYSYAGDLNFNFSTNGYFTFVPTESDVGSHLITFIVQDNSNCFRGIDSIEVMYTILDLNDPPVYVQIIPDVSFYEGTSSRGVYLRNHFEDPDDILTNFTVFASSTNINIKITSAFEVIYTAAVCGDYTAIFRATDPHGLYAESGVIEIEVECIPEEEEGETAGGAGGFPSDCVSDWRCSDWSRCYSNSTRKKVCTDIYACQDDYIQNFWESCVYVPHCSNGVLDEDEEGVDCGGKDCDACVTCTDGILNNLEEEIDCGGPNCNPCKNCFDGIQNYGEADVDCGGYCSPCPSCFDGIQNFGETGVDCGGSCDPCAKIETPSPLRFRDSKLVNLLILAILIVAALFLIIKLTRAKLLAAITSIRLFFTRNYQKQILLNLHQKSTLLTKLSTLDSKNLLIKNKLFEFKEELIKINKELFEDLINPYTDIKELKNQIEKLPTTQLVKELVSRHYANFINLQDNELTMLDLTLISEFTRLSVLDFSDSTIKDVRRKVNSIDIDMENVSAETTMKIIYNSILALQFENLESSKKNYFEALEIYNKLSYVQQEKVYSYLNQIFDNIKYITIINKR